MFREDEHPRDEKGRFTFKGIPMLALVMRDVEKGDLSEREKEILKKYLNRIRSKRKTKLDEEYVELSRIESIYNSPDQYIAPSFYFPKRIKEKMSKKEQAEWYEKCNYISYNRSYLERHGNTYYVDVGLKIVVTRFFENEFEAREIIKFANYLHMDRFIKGVKVKGDGRRFGDY